MKAWIDRITDEQIKYFLKTELNCEKVTCIKRYRQNDEITCKVLTLWNGEPEDTYKNKKGVLAMTDAFTIRQSCISTSDYSVEDIQTKWQMYQIALGIHPWQTENPYSGLSDGNISDVKA